MIFVDTSALYEATDVDADEHTDVKAAFARALDAAEPLITHNYVVVETLALVHRRMGRAIAVGVHAWLAAVDIVWVDTALHASAFEDFRQRPSERVSFVDCVSFAVMRARGIRKALALDDDFRAEGFDLIEG